jgi:hypothetical protein
MMIPLRSLVPEHMENPNLPGLEQEAKAFAERLIRSGIVASQNQSLTATQERPGDYAEDLGEVIRNAVIHWIDVENSRGGR